MLREPRRYPCVNFDAGNSLSFAGIEASNAACDLFLPSALNVYLGTFVQALDENPDDRDSFALREGQGLFKQVSRILRHTAIMRSPERIGHAPTARPA